MPNLFCSSCNEECSIVQVEEDYAFFPYTQRSLRSSCCQSYIKRSDETMYFQSELKEPYIKQLSMEETNAMLHG